MARKPLSGVDTAWLRMEDPTNLMMITGVMIFDTPMDFQRLKTTLEHRLLRFDRFRQRVVTPWLPLGSYYWQDDPRFDLNKHVQCIALPPPGDQAALQDVVGHLMSTPLALSKPLWEIHLVECYGDGCALIVRLHHCIADGIALVRLLLSLTDTTPDAPWPTATSLKTHQDDGGMLNALFQPASAALKTTMQLTNTLVEKGRQLLGQPSRALELAQLGGSAVSAAGRLVLRWPDLKTLFKGKLGVDKRVAWSDPIPLADVKAVGQSVGGTVNDVLLTAVTGALRSYLQGRGDPVQGVGIRAVVPVNLRPLERELRLGNKFGLVFLSLPVGIAEPTDRLFELKRRMDELKDTPEAIVTFGILNAIGLSPSEIQNTVVNIFGTKGTAVMTNVPGPRETIYLAGAPLETLMFWVPQSGRLGLGASILSYDGKVWLGVASDQGLVPDPETIVAAFHAEFAALAALTEQALFDEAESPTTLQEMETQLESAMQKIDEMIASKATPRATPERCQALTKIGRQCKNRPLPGSDFCHVHQKESTATS